MSAAHVHLWIAVLAVLAGTGIAVYRTADRIDDIEARLAAAEQRLLDFEPLWPCPRCGASGTRRCLDIRGDGILQRSPHDHAERQAR